MERQFSRISRAMTSRRLKQCGLDFRAVFYLDGSVPPGDEVT
jgi:hypothetical protein